MMRAAALIATREFLENARTKGFWFGIFMMPMLMFASVLAPALLESKAIPTRYFVMVDGDGVLEKAFDRHLERRDDARWEAALRDHVRKFLKPGATWNADGAPASGVDRRKILEARAAEVLKEGAPAFVAPRSLYVRAPLPSEAADLLKSGVGVEEIERVLRPWMRGERELETLGGASSGRTLFAAVIVPRGYVESAGRGVTGEPIRFWASNLADKGLSEEVENVAKAELRRRVYERAGVDLKVVTAAESVNVRVASFNPKKAEGKERVGLSEMLRQWIPVFFSFLLWMAIFPVTQMLLNSVIEEKSNRIIEVLISSVTPTELMMGKLGGIAMVGVVMVGAWVASVVGVLFWVDSTFKGAAAALGGAESVAAGVRTIISGTWLLPAFVVYFVLGYLLFAAIILAIGSTCSTLKESQNYMAVIVLLMMAPLLVSTYIPRDPNGALATALSWVPLFTPFVMMNRVTADPPWRDVIGTMVLLVGTVIAALWGAGRVFRAAILRTGQPPRLREWVRWLTRGDGA